MIYTDYSILLQAQSQDTRTEVRKNLEDRKNPEDIMLAARKSIFFLSVLSILFADGAPELKVRNTRYHHTLEVWEILTFSLA